MLGVRSRRGHPPRAFPRRFVPVFGQLIHLPASRRRSFSRAAAAISLALAAPGAAPLAAQDAEPWRIVPQPQSTQVLARDGSLVAEFGRQVRTNVALRTLPKYLPQAFIAVEDKRFYQHDGVDIIGIGGALKD